MPYQRKYDFQPGKKASSGQVDEEFDNLITAVNNIETETRTKETPLGAQEKADSAQQAAINASVQHAAGTKKMMMQAYKSGNITIPAGSYAGVVVTFPVAFAETPHIADTMFSGSSALGCTVGLSGETPTGVKIWVYNHSDAAKIVIVDLLIYGTKSL